VQCMFELKESNSWHPAPGCAKLGTLSPGDAGHL